MKGPIDPKEFETEARRVARQLWPNAEGGGAETIDNRERDGVFETEDVIHLLECTTSRSRDKAAQDAEKLASLARKLQSEDATKAVKCWFITREDPTADQQSAIKRHGGLVVAVSLEQFRSKLIDVRSYLEIRNNYPFGSVRDPASGRADYDLSDYVPLEMVGVNGNLWSFTDLTNATVEGRRFVVLGDYGAGKSTTLRQLFKESAKMIWRSKSVIFPVMLNLRDHQGQKNPAEALERHANIIGFSSPPHLVRAWRAGYVALLLDGFDEIAAAGWAGRTRKLQDLRYQSMELIRQFVLQTPTDSALVISGRAHFFDDLKELRRAMSLSNDFEILNLNEFTEEQVNEFLTKKGWKHSIPEWLPSRPLLLGYLASRKLLQETLSGEEAPTPAAGWNSLLDRICKRESEIEVGVDPDTIRRIIERLATFARNSKDGLGPLLPDQVLQGFIEVVGQPPDDRGHVLIQRLPGLGINIDKGLSSDAINAQDGSRRFIDQAFAEAAASGDVYRFIENPYKSPLDSSGWICSLPSLGIEVLAHRCRLATFADGKISAAIERASAQSHQGTLSADIVRTLLALGQKYTGAKAFIRGTEVPDLDFDLLDTDFSELCFQESILHDLVIPPDLRDEMLPSFENCIINELAGRTGPNDIPQEKFIGTEINKFQETAETTNAILSLDVPIGVRVMLTILRKLYIQKGRGRRENALFRGLDASIRHVVPSVLSELRRDGLVTLAHYTDHNVWLPARSAEKRAYASRILQSPHNYSDSLINRCASI